MKPSLWDKSPEQWKRSRLRSLIAHSSNGVWGSDSSGLGEIAKCIRATDFDRVRLQVSPTGGVERSFSPDDLAANQLRPGDILLEKSGGGKTQPVGKAVIFNSSNRSVCSNFVERLQPAPAHSSTFVCYLFEALYSAGLNTRYIKQSTGIQNLDSFGYFNERVALPPLDEQRAIERFLDVQTARCDALIEKKRCLRETLRTLLRTKVTLLVKHETNQGNSVPLKRVAPFVTSGSRGWATHYSDQGANFIRVGNLREDSICLNTNDLQKVVPPAGAEARRTLAHAGDVLISITALIGAVGVVPAGLTGYVNQHLALVRPDQDIVDSRWLAICLFSDVGQRQFQSELYGGTKQGLGLEDVRNLRIPLPTKALQEQLVDRAERALTQTARISDIVEQTILRLSEYRAALITAAVTGQIDIPGAA